MNQLATWLVTVITSITAPTQVERLRSETEAQMKARYESIASDMADVIQSQPALFANDTSKHRTSSLMVAIAFYESGFIKSVDTGARLGDNKESFCLMQIHLGKRNVYFGPEEMHSWSGKDLNADRKKCMRAGLEALRLSVNKCAEGPRGALLNLYASGNCGQASQEAHHRWKFAKMIEKKYPLAVIAQD